MILICGCSTRLSRVLMLPITRTGEREYRRGHIPRSAFLNLFRVHDPDRSRL